MMGQQIRGSTNAKHKLAEKCNFLSMSQRSNQCLGGKPIITCRLVLGIPCSHSFVDPSSGLLLCLLVVAVMGDHSGIRYLFSQLGSGVYYNTTYKRIKWEITNCT